ncbi:MAG: hypothetical protein KAT05_15645 [Spirochaetes bacterium]|nr:hypothetical protein [Spirochaetota bacterium]
MRRSSKILETYNKIVDSINNQFSNIIEKTSIIYSESSIPIKVRIFLIDKSFIDVFISLSGKYSYHWERRLINNKIYRHDNAPHEKHKNIKTYPKHFHFEDEKNVLESYISDAPILAIVEFMEFVSEKINGV